MTKKKQAEESQEQAQESAAKEGFVKVRYEGPGDYVNYDIAPYNIVEDPQVPGTYGQRALLDSGGEYEVPEDLAQNLAVTGGFEPADEKAEELFNKHRGEPSAEAEEDAEEDASERTSDSSDNDEASSEDADGGEK